MRCRIPNPTGSATHSSAVPRGPSGGPGWSIGRHPPVKNKDDLLTGVGSKTAGGRWNPPKSFPTVYSSLDPHTALDEVLAHFRYYGFPIESAMPRVTVSIRARLVGVLDLTDGKTRAALRVSERRMLDEPGGKSRRRVA